jgi:EAL domain-containing protein (putative c-di-GMP-specific phosphodiesterase class I)
MSEQEQYLELIADELGWDDPRTILARAIENGSFCLYGQDIVGIKSGARLGLEVLVRMREEEDLLLPPGAFIPILEHFSMMPALDQWVVGKVAPIANASPSSTLHFINVSMQTLTDRGFLEQVARVATRYPSAASKMYFEVDEQDARTSCEETLGFASAVKDFGFRLALDHFGKSRVSFELLKHVHADYVKLDFGLVLGLGRGDAVAITKLRAIHRVCRSIDIEPIAQCVESADVCKRLSQLGIDYAQGCHFCVPAPLEVAAAPTAT